MKKRQILYFNEKNFYHKEKERKEKEENGRKPSMTAHHAFTAGFQVTVGLQLSSV